jgi:hypothetical protein
MDRLIATNSVPFANADTAPATGTAQYATSGNPVTNTPATIFPAYAWNMLQDEIYNVIIAAGLTPNRNAWNQLLTAIETMLQGSTTNVGVDTGAANAYVVAFTPALTAPVPWVPFWFEVAHTNTGASTLNATGTVEPLVGGAHLALQGGEMVAKGNALVYWNPTLNSNAGAYVLMFCSGAPDQIAPGTQPEHAVQWSQVVGIVGASRNAFMHIATAGTSASWQASELILETSAGLNYCLRGGISGTINLATTGAGGMDTGSAPASGFVGIYGIWNPTTQTFNLLAQNATGVLLPEVYSGAHMPSGYTASALVAVLLTNASSQFLIQNLRDRTVGYASRAEVAATAATSGITALSVGGDIPQNARYVSGTFSLTQTSNGNVIAAVYQDANGLGAQTANSGSGAGSAVASASGNFNRLLLTSTQTLYYQVQVSAGGTITAGINFTGFEF